MCFRLLIAVTPSPSETLEALGARHGLDVRPFPREDFAELAWGDCACSLYTKAEGGARVTALVRSLAATARVQLLLFTDDEPPTLEGTIEVVPVKVLAARGVSALPEGRVAEIRA